MHPLPNIQPEYSTRYPDPSAQSLDEIREGRTGLGSLRESRQILGHGAEIVGELVGERCTLGTDRDMDSSVAAPGVVGKTVAAQREMTRDVGQMTKPPAQGVVVSMV